MWIACKRRSAYDQHPLGVNNLRNTHLQHGVRVLITNRQDCLGHRIWQRKRHRRRDCQGLCTERRFRGNSLRVGRLPRPERRRWQHISQRSSDPMWLWSREPCRNMELRRELSRRHLRSLVPTISTFSVSTWLVHGVPHAPTTLPPTAPLSKLRYFAGRAKLLTTHQSTMRPPCQ